MVPGNDSTRQPLLQKTRNLLHFDGFSLHFPALWPFCAGNRNNSLCKKQHLLRRNRHGFVQEPSLSNVAKTDNILRLIDYLSLLLGFMVLV